MGVCFRIREESTSSSESEDIDGTEDEVFHENSRNEKDNDEIFQNDLSSTVNDPIVEQDCGKLGNVGVEVSEEAGNKEYTYKAKHQLGTNFGCDKILTASDTCVEIQDDVATNNESLAKVVEHSPDDNYSIKTDNTLNILSRTGTNAVEDCYKPLQTQLQATLTSDDSKVNNKQGNPFVSFSNKNNNENLQCTEHTDSYESIITTRNDESDISITQHQSTPLLLKFSYFGRRDDGMEEKIEGFLDNGFVLKKPGTIDNLYSKEVDAIRYTKGTSETKQTVVSGKDCERIEHQFSEDELEEVKQWWRCYKPIFSSDKVASDFYFPTGNYSYNDESWPEISDDTEEDNLIGKLIDEMIQNSNKLSRYEVEDETLSVKSMDDSENSVSSRSEESVHEIIYNKDSYAPHQPSSQPFQPPLPTSPPPALPPLPPTPPPSLSPPSFSTLQASSPQPTLQPHLLIPLPPTTLPASLVSQMKLQSLPLQESTQLTHIPSITPPESMASNTILVSLQSQLAPFPVSSSKGLPTSSLQSLHGNVQNITSDRFSSSPHPVCESVMMEPTTPPKNLTNSHQNQSLPSPQSNSLTKCSHSSQRVSESKAVSLPHQKLLKSISIKKKTHPIRIQLSSKAQIPCFPPPRLTLFSKPDKRKSNHYFKLHKTNSTASNSFNISHNVSMWDKKPKSAGCTTVGSMYKEKNCLKRGHTTKSRLKSKKSDVLKTPPKKTNVSYLPFVKGFSNKELSGNFKKSTKSSHFKINSCIETKQDKIKINNITDELPVAHNTDRLITNKQLNKQHKSIKTLPNPKLLPKSIQPVAKPDELIVHKNIPEFVDDTSCEEPIYYQYIEEEEKNVEILFEPLEGNLKLDIWDEATISESNASNSLSNNNNNGATIVGAYNYTKSEQGKALLEKDVAELQSEDESNNRCCARNKVNNGFGEPFIDSNKASSIYNTQTKLAESITQIMVQTDKDMGNTKSLSKQNVSGQEVSMYSSSKSPSEDNDLTLEKPHNCAKPKQGNLLEDVLAVSVSEDESDSPTRVRPRDINGFGEPTIFSSEPSKSDYKSQTFQTKSDDLKKLTIIDQSDQEIDQKPYSTDQNVHNKVDYDCSVSKALSDDNNLVLIAGAGQDNCKQIEQHGVLEKVLAMSASADECDKSIHFRPKIINGLGEPLVLSPESHKSDCKTQTFKTKLADLKKPVFIVPTDEEIDHTPFSTLQHVHTQVYFDSSVPEALSDDDKLALVAEPGLDIYEQIEKKSLLEEDLDVSESEDESDYSIYVSPRDVNGFGKPPILSSETSVSDYKMCMFKTKTVNLKKPTAIVQTDKVEHQTPSSTVQHVQCQSDCDSDRSKSSSNNNNLDLKARPQNCKDIKQHSLFEENLVLSAPADENDNSIHARPKVINSLGKPLLLSSESFKSDHKTQTFQTKSVNVKKQIAIVQSDKETDRTASSTSQNVHTQVDFNSCVSKASSDDSNITLVAEAKPDNCKQIEQHCLLEEDLSISASEDESGSQIDALSRAINSFGDPLIISSDVVSSSKCDDKTNLFKERVAHSKSQMTINVNETNQYTELIKHTSRPLLAMKTARSPTCSSSERKKPNLKMCSPDADCKQEKNRNNSENSLKNSFDTVTLYPVRSPVIKFQSGNSEQDTFQQNIPHSPKYEAVMKYNKQIGKKRVNNKLIRSISTNTSIQNEKSYKPTELRKHFTNQMEQVFPVNKDKNTMESSTTTSKAYKSENQKKQLGLKRSFSMPVEPIKEQNCSNLVLDNILSTMEIPFKLKTKIDHNKNNSHVNTVNTIKSTQMTVSNHRKYLTSYQNEGTHLVKQFSLDRPENKLISIYNVNTTLTHSDKTKRNDIITKPNIKKEMENIRDKNIHEKPVPSVEKINTFIKSTKKTYSEQGKNVVCKPQSTSCSAPKHCKEAISTQYKIKALERFTNQRKYKPKENVKKSSKVGNVLPSMPVVVSEAKQGCHEKNYALGRETKMDEPRKTETRNTQEISPHISLKVSIPIKLLNNLSFLKKSIINNSARESLGTLPTKKIKLCANDRKDNLNKLKKNKERHNSEISNELKIKTNLNKETKCNIKINTSPKHTKEANSKRIIETKNVYSKRMRVDNIAEERNIPKLNGQSSLNEAVLQSDKQVFRVPTMDGNFMVKLPGIQPFTENSVSVSRFSVGNKKYTENKIPSEVLIETEFSSKEDNTVTLYASDSGEGGKEDPLKSSVLYNREPDKVHCDEVVKEQITKPDNIHRRNHSPTKQLPNLKETNFTTNNKSTLNIPVQSESPNRVQTPAEVTIVVAEESNKLYCSPAAQKRRISVVSNEHLFAGDTPVRTENNTCPPDFKTNTEHINTRPTWYMAPEASPSNSCENLSEIMEIEIHSVKNPNFCPPTSHLINDTMKRLEFLNNFHSSVSKENSDFEKLTDFIEIIELDFKQNSEEIISVKKLPSQDVVESELNRIREEFQNKLIERENNFRATLLGFVQEFTKKGFHAGSVSMAIYVQLSKKVISLCKEKGEVKDKFLNLLKQWLATEESKYLFEQNEKDFERDYKTMKIWLDESISSKEINKLSIFSNKVLNIKSSNKILAKNTKLPTENTVVNSAVAITSTTDLEVTNNSPGLPVGLRPKKDILSTEKTHCQPSKPIYSTRDNVLDCVPNTNAAAVPFFVALPRQSPNNVNTGNLNSQVNIIAQSINQNHLVQSQNIPVNPILSPQTSTNLSKNCIGFSVPNIRGQYKQSGFGNNNGSSEELFSTLSQETNAAPFQIGILSMRQGDSLISGPVGHDSIHAETFSKSDNNSVLGQHRKALKMQPLVSSFPNQQSVLSSTQIPTQISDKPMQKSNESIIQDHNAITYLNSSGFPHDKATSVNVVSSNCMPQVASGNSQQNIYTSKNGNSCKKMVTLHQPQSNLSTVQDQTEIHPNFNLGVSSSRGSVHLPNTHFNERNYQYSSKQKEKSRSLQLNYRLKLNNRANFNSEGRNNSGANCNSNFGIRVQNPSTQQFYVQSKVQQVHPNTTVFNMEQNAQQNLRSSTFHLANANHQPGNLTTQPYHNDKLQIQSNQNTSYPTVQHQMVNKFTQGNVTSAGHQQQIIISGQMSSYETTSIQKNSFVYPQILEQNHHIYNTVPHNTNTVHYPAQLKNSSNITTIVPTNNSSQSTMCSDRAHKLLNLENALNHSDEPVDVGLVNVSHLEQNGQQHHKLQQPNNLRSSITNSVGQNLFIAQPQEQISNLIDRALPSVGLLGCNQPNHQESVTLNTQLSHPENIFQSNVVFFEQTSNQNSFQDQNHLAHSKQMFYNCNTEVGPFTNQATNQYSKNSICESLSNETLNQIQLTEAELDDISSLFQNNPQFHSVPHETPQTSIEESLALVHNQNNHTTQPFTTKSYSGQSSDLKYLVLDRIKKLKIQLNNTGYNCKVIDICGNKLYKQDFILFLDKLEAQINEFGLTKNDETTFIGSLTSTNGLTFSSKQLDRLTKCILNVYKTVTIDQSNSSKDENLVQPRRYSQHLEVLTGWSQEELIQDQIAMTNVGIDKLKNDSINALQTAKRSYRTLQEMAARGHVHAIAALKQISRTAFDEKH